MHTGYKGRLGIFKYRIFAYLLGINLRRQLVFIYLLVLWGLIITEQYELLPKRKFKRAFERKSKSKIRNSHLR